MSAPSTPLRIMNTRTHAMEPFSSVEPGHVRMYVCGPSVYDESHLGHARSYVVYDVMKRYFLEHGYRVTHVQNFTDVEENIATRAAAAGLAPLAYAERLIARFFRDMDALRVKRATHYPRVSEHIGDIIKVVETLEKKHHAYRFDCGPRPTPTGDKHEGPAESNLAAGMGCDVYFDVTKTPQYGELIGTSIEELTVERPTQSGDRQNPLDFALWKSRDDWGVTWESPWGRGRPGWHVECTTMATKYLGPDFDIHGGGLDLVFPHHENERAIGEAITGERYCNAFLHNGFVTVGNEKMSKSLGNFVTIDDLLSRHDPEVLRAFLLSQHYRGPLNYDEKSMRAALVRVEAWRAGVSGLQARAGDAAPTEGAALGTQAQAARDAFWAALANDFHFDAALDALDKATAASAGLTGGAAASQLAFFTKAGATLGLFWELEQK